MASTLTIENKEYVTATVAGKHFEYTKEYILLLIKQGKIDGRKVGYKWYVHIPSAEVFFRDAKEVRSQRNVLVSNVRKIELHQYSKIHATPKRHRILAETFAVLIIALSIGTIGYMGTTPQVAAVTEGNSGFFETLAVSLYSFVSPREIMPHTSSLVAEIIPIETDAISAQIGTTTHTALVVAPGEIFTATTIDSVRDSFSDPVEVSMDLNNPDTGIITPVFKDSKGEEYRFLMVPVKIPIP